MFHTTRKKTEDLQESNNAQCIYNLCCPSDNPNSFYINIKPTKLGLILVGDLNKP